MYNNVFIEILKCINIYLYLINKFNKMMVEIVIKCIRIYLDLLLCDILYN